MELDIQALAEKLIVEMWAESERQKERAEGVKIFLREMIAESERLNKVENGQEENKIPVGSPQGQE
jgi:hypothetical protein